MTPDDFICELFGHEWTYDQLPVFLEIVKSFKRDSERYYEIREFLIDDEWIASREKMKKIDEIADLGRLSGLL